MHQRDYILRLIEQLGVALVELRKRILVGGSADTEERLARAAGQVGVSLELLRRFDLSTLVLLISPSGEVDPTRCWIIAEVLYLDGLEESLSGRGGGESLLKARALYDMVRPAGGMIVGMPEAAERIAEIDRRIEELQHGDTDTDRRPRRVKASRLSPSVEGA